MSAREIAARIKSTPPGSALDWPTIRETIHDEYDTALPVERENLLTVFHALMDAVERQISPVDLDTFRKTRREDYNLLLIKECAEADGNVSPHRLRVVTQREVNARRMQPDDELYKLALGGIEAMPGGQERAPAKRGLFSRWRKTS